MWTPGSGYRPGDERSEASLRANRVNRMSVTMSSTKTRAALRVSARVSGELLLVLVMTAVALWLVGQMWSVVWPLVVGLLLTTLTWPLARFLRNHSWPPALAASVVTVFALIAVPVASESGTLADGVIAGVEQLRTWAAGPPMNIGDAEITKAMDAGI